MFVNRLPFRSWLTPGCRLDPDLAIGPSTAMDRRGSLVKPPVLNEWTHCVWPSRVAFELRLLRGGRPSSLLRLSTHCSPMSSAWDIEIKIASGVTYAHPQQWEPVVCGCGIEKSLPSKGGLSNKISGLLSQRPWAAKRNFPVPSNRKDGPRGPFGPRQY